MFSDNGLLRRLNLKKQLITLSLLGSVCTGNARAQQWETLGSAPGGISSGWGSFQHLAKDASGNIYASFYDGSVTKGSVMKYNGSSWSYLGSAGITTGPATYNGLAVAANGDVFYCNQASWPATGVEVRRFNGSAWTQLPTAGNTTANFQSLATTANDQPIVAYSSNGQPNVKRYDGTSWLNVGVGLPTETPYYIDLKVVNDTAYVGWTGTSGVRVFKIHALALGLASWQEVGTTGFAGTSNEQYRSAITVDASNNVYVAYTSNTANGNKINVKKYTLATGVWTDVGAANFSTHRVHYVSIAVTASGVPYVAYSHFENTPDNKNYVMKFNGTTWEQVGTGPVSSGEAKWNALLIDNAGTPVLAYSDESMTAGNMVKKFVPGTVVNNIDSVKVHTQNNVAPIVTSGVLATQASATIQLAANVFPATAAQTVAWTVPTGNSATSTVNSSGLVTIPAQTQGLAWIKAASSVDATRSDSLQLQVYCSPNSGNSTFFKFDTVRITGTTLDHHTPNGPANYNFIPESSTSTATLVSGQSYNLFTAIRPSVMTGSNYSYSIWIDHNRNGIFEASEFTELVGSAGTAAEITNHMINIPQSIVPGKTLMRLKTRLAGGANDAASVCGGLTNSGHILDLIVTLEQGSSTACNNTMPGTAAGSTGCVTFNYLGAPVTYTTVRANDGNVWLQQNMGSAQVGNVKTDTLAYGHMFQWGRWDDGHQLRTSATGAAPSPNDPTGIGTGSTTFYTGSGTAAWWNGGALSDTWAATTNTQVTATDGCDPCKAMGAGWRLPTETEWAGVVSSEMMTNTNTAFSSNLKLVIGGSRSFTNGAYSFEGTRGYYWSSTTSSTGAKYLYYSDAVMNASAGNNRGGGAAVRCIYSQTVGVTAVDVTTQNNVPATITAMNGTLQLEADVLPATANQNVTWSVQSGTAFASVDNAGLVTAIANGTATIRATSVSNPAQYDEIAVVINTTSPCVAVSSFYENFDAPALTCCNMGVVPECWASLSTGTGANQIISNTGPASGANNIYQFGYGPGLASIVIMREVNNINAGTHQFRFKLRANSGPGNLDFGYITDINNAATFVTLQTISVTNSSYSDPIAERTLLVPTTVPSNARLAIRNPGTSWAGFYWDDAYWEPISTTAIQSVDVTTQNNVAATITNNGGTLQTVATVLPLTANQNVTWSIVPGTGTATISATGLVTPQSNGLVYAKAVSVSDATKMDSLLITISNQVTPAASIDVTTANNAPATINTNSGTLQMTASILPAAADQDVTWSIVPGTGAASISATGLVTAQTNGIVYAKAIAVANAGLTDSLMITISDQTIAVTDLTVSTINNAPAVIAVHEGTLPLQAIVMPTNATDQAVSWSIIPVSGTATISTTGVVTAQTNGTVYAKAVAVEDPAISDSLLITISDQGGVGIKEISNGLSFEMHPNPAKTHVVIALSEAGIGTTMTLISIDGRVLMQGSFDGKRKAFDISNIAKGNYLVRLQTKQAYAIKKLVIE